MQLDRRTFLKTAIGASTLAQLGVFQAENLMASNVKSNVMVTETLPNILYVIIEDVGPHFRCYGEPLASTPAFDEFSRSGIQFNQVFATAPVCSASRSSLMTGAHQISTGTHQHRTWEWRKPDLPHPIMHICDWLRQAGYFTCNLRPGADLPKGIKTMLNGAHGSGKLDLNFKIHSPQEGDPFDGWDWTQRENGQPFFAHITIMETHKMGGWKLAREIYGASCVNPDEVKLPPHWPDHEISRDEYANYLDALRLADGYFAELLERLDREGLAENTIVILSSDHGAHFRGKQFVYDEGLRIPLIIRFPDGKFAGTKNNTLVSGVDIVPTILGFAGIKPTEGSMHGRDLFSAESVEPQAIFAARDRMDESIDRMRVIRTQRYKYIRNYLPSVPYMQPNFYKESNYPTWNLVKELALKNELSVEAARFASPVKPVEELYDVENDKWELNNLAGKPEFRSTLVSLRGQLDSFLAKMDKATTYEDPIEIYRGRWNELPEDGNTNSMFKEMN